VTGEAEPAAKKRKPTKRGTATKATTGK
jgi:hypothetical protein